LSKTRPLNEKKYGISKHRYLEVYHFCLQYNEWKDELKYATTTVGSMDYTAVRVQTSPNGDGTLNLASRRVELTQKCELIEQTAIEVDADIYQYLIKAVTNESITYNYLNMIMRMPCCRDTYYNKRRQFYWLLSQRI